MLTIKEKVINTLRKTRARLACHEFPELGTNECSISAALRVLAGECKVVGTVRPGTHYKEWQLTQVYRAQIDPDSNCGPLFDQREKVDANT